MRERPDLVLVGCVKSKRTRPSAARDLYDSPLWRCRRRYAEQAGVPWFILSAEHGLLPPEARIRFYDTTLATFAASERRKWSWRVLRDLLARFPDPSGKTVEIHAGKLYVDHGLVDGLREAGAIVRLPLSGVVGIGAQCRWYGEQTGGDPQLGEEGMTEAARLAEMIASDFYDGRLDFSARSASDGGWSDMPEVNILPDGVTASRTARRFLTFIAAMDRMRDANALWRDGAELLRRHSEVFDPSVGASMKYERLKELLSAYRVSKFHEPDTKAWRTIAANLAAGDGPVCRVVESGDGDAEELLRDLRSRDEHGRARFPLLRGRKIGPMWVRMMAEPGGATIRRLDLVPVAVDVQVRRVTENLGVTETRGLPLAQAKPKIQAAWFAAVAAAARIGGPERIRGTCAALDPALWFFGKHGCSHCERVKRRVRFGRACQHCRLPVPGSG